MNDPGSLGPRDGGTRFGCGVLFGLVLGAFASLAWVEGPATSMVSFILFVALVCGVLATLLGDRFWLNVRRYLWWLG